jgi:ubiquinone/menaquinone biosynthesis C-methylase UbiE
VTVIDYDQGLARAYHAGRAMSEAMGRLWMEALARHLSARAGLTILDLGAGTGRFSPLLADAFGARVLAVEPSDMMRAEAQRHHPHPRVAYVAGSAERVPAGDGECDAAFLSMVVHHVRNLAAGARELRRVVRPGGVLFVRNVFAGRLTGVRYFEFFPEARALDEARLPTVAAVRDTFLAEGFAYVAFESVRQEIDPSLAAHYERIKRRALSTLALLSDAEFEAGLERMRRAAEAETRPRPVTEEIDLLVLRRAGA